VTVDPAPEQEVEIELEREDGMVHFEIEMEWPETEVRSTTTLPRARRPSNYTQTASTSGAGGSSTTTEHHRRRRRWVLGQTRRQVGHRERPAERARRPRDRHLSRRGGTRRRRSDATFEIFRDTADEHRWRLRHDNGNVIADGGQGYASKQKAKQGLNSVKSNAPGAAVEEAGDGEPTDEEEE